MKRLLLRAVFVLLVAPGIGGVQAQDAASKYPAKPVRMVIGMPPGGGNDILARLVGQKLSEAWGQPVLVENRPGANGIISAELVAKSTPDGYTLLIGPSGVMVMNPAIYDKLPYDPQKDFVPITITAAYPLVLTVHPSVAVKSARELIALAKSKPDQLTYSSGASAFQMATELFKSRTGTDFRHIPYKGSAQSINALLAGDVTMSLVDTSPVLSFLKAGKLRALAVTSATRLDSLPEVPTMAEAGVPNLEIGLWSGVFAPAGTPPAIVSKLSSEIAKVVQMPVVKSMFEQLGVIPVGGTSEQTAATLRSEIQTWTAIAKSANIKAEQ
jgi:tripartite-type tricarboxylate transporter receptor subunit TctC